MNQSFTECFGKIEDPRIERTKKHKLLDIIALAILGIMAGAQSFEEIEDFGSAHQEWLEAYLELKNGIPSHDTINRVCQMLSPESFQSAFLEWLNVLKNLLPEGVVAIDGKTLCGSHERIKGLKGLHVVSAWSCNNGLSLGQIKVADKTNEITAIPDLLKRLMIKGAVITIDAMGCQRDIAAGIIKQEANYVLAVKGNQGELYESIQDCFKLAKDDSFYTAREGYNKDHGRIEERSIAVLPAKILEGLVDISPWMGIQSIAKVHAKRESAYEKSEEIRYYISSLSDARSILEASRAHWQIENNLHWSLDVAFREDDCRVRDEHAALNLAWMRKMALSFLKAENSFKASIRRKQLKLWNDPNYALKVLGI